MRIADRYNREQKQLLIEGCKVMAKDMIQINEEWEAIDSDIDWECNVRENGFKKRRHSDS